MASPEENKTPLNATNFSCQKRTIFQNRSAPTALSKSGLTPCRRIGLKRKSTPGIIFKSPLKDNNSILSEKTVGSLTPIIVKNNLFSNTPELSSRSKTELRTSSTENGAKKTFYSHKSDGLSLKNKTYQTCRKVSTPILSRLGRIGTCSLNKKRKLSSDEPSDQTTQRSDSSSSSLSELSEVLNKNHSSFLKVYNDSIFKSQEGEEEDPQKREAILRMKNMFDQITELKQSLINAKQHDISNLESLTEKWRDGCQRALFSLLDKLRDQGHECDMSQLLLKTGIPSKLVNYDEDIQDFIT